MRNDHKLVQGTRPDHWVLFPPRVFWAGLFLFVLLAAMLYPLVVLTTSETWDWGQGAWSLAIWAFTTSAVISVEREDRKRVKREDS